MKVWQDLNFPSFNTIFLVVVLPSTILTWAGPDQNKGMCRRTMSSISAHVGCSWKRRGAQCTITRCHLSQRTIWYLPSATAVFSSNYWLILLLRFLCGRKAEGAHLLCLKQCFVHWTRTTLWYVSPCVYDKQCSIAVHLWPWLACSTKLLHPLRGERKGH